MQRLHPAVSELGQAPQVPQHGLCIRVQKKWQFLTSLVKRVYITFCVGVNHWGPIVIVIKTARVSTPISNRDGKGTSYVKMMAICLGETHETSVFRFSMQDTMTCSLRIETHPKKVDSRSNPLGTE